MKVLHVNFSDIRGGAARAAYRLHLGLQNHSVQSSMLVIRKKSGDNTVTGPKNLINYILLRLGWRLESMLTRIKGGKILSFFSPGLVPGADIKNQLTSAGVDVINLHWTCQAMLRIEDLQQVSTPIVWTLHDLWPLTGGCHSDEGCRRYQAECGNCPILSKRGEFDLSHQVLSRKQASYSNLDINLVAPSQWMANNARESTLFKNQNIHVIYNGIDLTIFRPTDSQQTRQLLGLPKDRLLMLFGAMNSTNNPGKGFDLLVAGLNRLSKDWRDSVELVVFGSTGSSEIENSGFITHFLGDIYDDKKLVDLYSSVDVMIVPSRQDNLPNTVSESLACGTPVVAFDIGGIPEMIEHEVSGYLAKAFDPDDLARGVEYVLKQQRINNHMSRAARKMAVDKFSDEEMSLKYISLYETIRD